MKQRRYRLTFRRIEGLDREQRPYSCDRMTKLAGAHVIITGGSEGIGLATAQFLLTRGARISLVSRSEAKLGAAREQLGGQVAIASADVTQESSITGAIAALVTDRGPCDVLVTCAGAAVPGYFNQLGDSFRTQMELNYFGTVHAIRAVVPSMIEGDAATSYSSRRPPRSSASSDTAPTRRRSSQYADSVKACIQTSRRMGSSSRSCTRPTPRLRVTTTRTAPSPSRARRSPPRSSPYQLTGREGDHSGRRARSPDDRRRRADAQTAILARTARLLGPIVRASMARTVRKAQQRRADLS